MRGERSVVMNTTWQRPGLAWTTLGPTLLHSGPNFYSLELLSSGFAFYTQNNRRYKQHVGENMKLSFQCNAMSTETLSLRLSLSLSLSRSKSSWNKLHFPPFANILMTWVFLWILWDCQNVDGIEVIISSSLAAQQPAFSRWYLQTRACTHYSAPVPGSQSSCPCAFLRTWSSHPFVSASTFSKLTLMHAAFKRSRASTGDTGIWSFLDWICF